ncbi:MAG: hypothetical protein HY714_02570 [Candidatus Omnitrophica bacterium]|nr:hypothetical protein [Candidatus Omnitrophota bacterium]
MSLKMHLQVMSLKGLLFDEQVESVYLNGDDGEFEVLPFHYPMMASLPEGEIKIAGHEPIPLKVGVLKFDGNECTIIMEESESTKTMLMRWDEQSKKQ